MGLKVHGLPQDWMGSYQNSLSPSEHASVLRMGFECRFTSRHAFARQQPADAAVPNSREPASATSDSRNAAGVGHCTNAPSHSSQIMKFLVCRKGESKPPCRFKLWTVSWQATTPMDASSGHFRCNAASLPKKLSTTPARLSQAKRCTRRPRPKRQRHEGPEV